MTIEFKLSDEDFERIRAIVQEEISKALQQRQPKYYTRKEAATLLRISLPTLDSWVRKGKITPIKVENRTLFEETELAIK